MSCTKLPEVDLTFTVDSLPFVCFSPLIVQPVGKLFTLRRIASAALAGLLVASLLFASALAASPELHQQFHHHQDGQANDFCAVTLLKNSQVLLADPASTPLVFVLLFLFCLPLAAAVGLFPVDLRLDFGRAPPAFVGLQ